MENIKIRTNGCKNCSEKIQVELFRLGCKWLWGAQETYDKRFSETPNYIFRYKKLITFTNGNGVFFKEHPGKELTLQNLIDMPTPVEFEVKTECEWYNYHCSGDHSDVYCNKFKEYIELPKRNCHNCDDYEKKKEVVRIYGELDDTGHIAFGHVEVGTTILRYGLDAEVFKFFIEVEE